MTRVKYFDVLNILACLSVVFLHHNALVHGWQASSAWAQSLIIEVVCFWAVPVFLMLSGATLLDYRKKYDTKTFFKKRSARVLYFLGCLGDYKYYGMDKAIARALELFKDIK